MRAFAFGPDKALTRLSAMPEQRIVAVGLLTENDLRLLGPTFDRVWPIEEAPDFSDLLQAIDAADRETAVGTSDRENG